MNCHSCSKQYDDDSPPMALFCGHSMCKKCSENKKCENVVCPVCKRLSKSVNLVVNASMLEVVRKLSKPCDKDPKTSTCVPSVSCNSCYGLFCDQCYQVHKLPSCISGFGGYKQESDSIDIECKFNCISKIAHKYLQHRKSVMNKVLHAYEQMKVLYVTSCQIFKDLEVRSLVMKHMFENMKKTLHSSKGNKSQEDLRNACKGNFSILHHARILTSKLNHPDPIPLLRTFPERLEKVLKDHRTISEGLAVSFSFEEIECALQISVRDKQMSFASSLTQKLEFFQDNYIFFVLTTPIYLDHVTLDIENSSCKLFVNLNFRTSANGFMGEFLKCLLLSDNILYISELFGDFELEFHVKDNSKKFILVASINQLRSTSGQLVSIAHFEYSKKDYKKIKGKRSIKCSHHYRIDVNTSLDDSVEELPY